MRKEKRFRSIAFGESVIRLALDRYNKRIECEHSDCMKTRIMSIETGDVEWSFDSQEEFFGNYRSLDFDSDHDIHYRLTTVCYEEQLSLGFRLLGRPRGTSVFVEAAARSQIEAVHSIFENASSDDLIPLEREQLEVEPVVFIGHGRSQLWRDLKDHLQDMQGYQIEAYEMGARAGHAIRDILDSMLGKSSFALIVMTAEDEMVDGTYQPRMNVVHELGLFQGSLGWLRAIMLLEDGAEDFSNMAGIQQIRFSKGNIREAFGDVLATLRREFPL